MHSAHDDDACSSEELPRRRGLVSSIWLLTGIAASVATVVGVTLEHWDTIKTWPRIVMREIEAIAPFTTQDDTRRKPAAETPVRIAPLQHWDTIKTWPRIGMREIEAIAPWAKHDDTRRKPAAEMPVRTAPLLCPASGDEEVLQSGRYLFRQEWEAGSACAAESLVGSLSERCEFSIEIREKTGVVACRALVDPLTREFRAREPGSAGVRETACLSGSFTQAIIASRVCGQGKLKILKRL